jgi:hypothetical protein
MKLILTIYLTALLTITMYGQNGDTCQCRLVYGNWFSPTLVTYHHDSLVTYNQATHIKDTLFWRKKEHFFSDTIYNVESYNWRIGRTLIVKNGNIGRMLNGNFYTLYPYSLQDSGEIKKVFWEDMDRIGGKTYKFLYGRKIEFFTQEKINGQLCNCYNYHDYLYSNIDKAYPSAEELNLIQFTDSFGIEGNGRFIPFESRCEFGNPQGNTPSNYCYLKGIGEVYRSKVKIYYLTPFCEKFIKKTFYQN